MSAARATGWIRFNRAAAERQHNPLMLLQLFDGPAFVLSKRRFAVPMKNLGNAEAGGSLDHVIQVDKLPAQAAGKYRPHGRFARAHKTGENQPGKRSHPPSADYKWALRAVGPEANERKELKEQKPLGCFRSF